MTMTEKYKIIAKFVKDISSETPNVDTYLFVKDNISNYSLNIDIKSSRNNLKIFWQKSEYKKIFFWNGLCNSNKN